MEMFVLKMGFGLVVFDLFINVGSRASIMAKTESMKGLSRFNGEVKVFDRRKIRFLPQRDLRSNTWTKKKKQDQDSNCRVFEKFEKRSKKHAFCDF